MKNILIIGIGAGNPDHLTLQAVKALNQADVFFLMDKGPGKHALNYLRHTLFAQHLTHRNYRIVESPSPERQRAGSDYRSTVAQLNAEKQRLYEQLIGEELKDNECGAFLVWGDPSLYDSTIRIMNVIVESGRHRLSYEVIPGITSVQALTARHKVPLNQIGQPIEITTGRRLANGLPGDAGSVVVMLDADQAFNHLIDQDLDIYWGAYLGTADEILIAGELKNVAREIEQVRAQARLAKGWIMDTYLLKRRQPKRKTP